jgi:hypothetical protein
MKTREVESVLQFGGGEALGKRLEERLNSPDNAGKHLICVSFYSEHCAWIIWETD